MQTTRKIVITAVVAVLAAPALGDWDEGDPHKMHQAQLPDPNGWDVDFYSEFGLMGQIDRITYDVSDDWQCTRTGAVTGFHFWVSMREDPTGPNPTDLPFEIVSVNARIYGNIPQGPGGYSIPDEDDLKWRGYFSPGETLKRVTCRYAGSGAQGWYDPLWPSEFPDDHENYYQINVTGIEEVPGEIDPPFVQQAGEIYWLELDVGAWDIETMLPVDLGWKTALPPGTPPANFIDPAVYWLEDVGYGISEYRQIVIEGLPRDLAFVITPEPGTISMLALASIGVLLRRRRKA